MAELAQAQESQKSGERPLVQEVFREWKGCYNRSSRTAMPPDRWYYLENIQPIGPGNCVTIPAISASLHDFAGDSVYWADYANVAGVDYIIAFSTNCKVFSYKISDGTTALIATGLSGAGSKLDQWKNSAIVVIDSSQYYSWDGTTWTTRGGTTGAPSSGQAIAVYAGRVWIAQSRILYYSAVDTLSDFQTASGGGSVTLTDSQIRSNVTQLKSANGYLYIFGRTSINVISDVYVPSGASPPTPVFTNLNVQAIIGTDQPGSVFAYNRSLMLANRYGAFALNGVTAQKISDDIDNTWKYADFSQSVSGGQVIVNNILTSAFLIKRANDPITGSATTLACWWDDKWWFANYGAVTFALSAYANNLPSLFGFIGNKLYQFFSSAASAPDSKFIGPLWNLTDSLIDKQVLRSGLEMQISALSGSISLSIDTEASSSGLSPSSALAFITWYGSGGPTQAIAFTNSGGAVIHWIANGYALFWSISPPGFGKYIGMRGTITGGQYQLSALMIDYKHGPSRWVSNA